MCDVESVASAPAAVCRRRRAFYDDVESTTRIPLRTYILPTAAEESGLLLYCNRRLYCIELLLTRITSVERSDSIRSLLSDHIPTTADDSLIQIDSAGLFISPICHLNIKIRDAMHLLP